MAFAMVKEGTGLTGIKKGVTDRRGYFGKNSLIHIRIPK